MLDATSALDEAGIASRVLKGVALSHTAYDDPSERVFGDVDLLVPGARAHPVVRGAGIGARRGTPTTGAPPWLR